MERIKTCKSSESILCQASLSTRREAIKSIFGLAGGCAVTQLVAARALALSADEPSSASGVNESNVQFRSGQATLQGYLVKPVATGQHPAVIVIHSDDGLDSNIKDLTRQLVQEGFVAFAPDLASRVAGQDSHQTRTAILHLDPDQTIQDATRAYQFVQKDTNVDPQKIAVVGLGWGSWRAMMLAERVSDLYRTVIYYGSVPTDGLDGIQSPVLAHFAQNDFRNTGNAVWVQATMTKSGRKFTYEVYTDADAEFMSRKNTPSNAEAARQSWKKTLEFLHSSS